MFLEYIVGVAVVFGGVIFFHELGHFLLAKLFGVKVKVFSLGFGTRLFGWKTSETDYRISLFPLGGYVKMEGEEPGEKIIDAQRAFSSKPRWQRMCICFAGPLANVILAFFVLAGVYMVRFEEPAYLAEVPRVGYVAPESPAALSGLRKGDTIITVDGRAVRSWREAILNIALAAGREPQLEIHRDAEGTKSIKLDLQKIDAGNPRALGSIGFVPAEPILVQGFTERSPARDAGMEIGDRIVSVSGVEIFSFSELVAIIRQSTGERLEFIVERRGVTRQLFVTPFFDKPENRWLIGFFVVNRMTVKKLAPMDAAAASFDRNKEIIGLTARAIVGMVRGTVSFRGVSGPVGIASYAGSAAQHGILPLLQLLAIVSIGLAILNILPIPPLDGGHIAILAVESALRRDLSAELKQGVAWTGIVLALLLFALGMWNDIGRLLTR